MEISNIKKYPPSEWRILFEMNTEDWLLNKASQNLTKILDVLESHTNKKETQDCWRAFYLVIRDTKILNDLFKKDKEELSNKLIDYIHQAPCVIPSIINCLNSKNSENFLENKEIANNFINAVKTWNSKERIQIQDNLDYWNNYIDLIKGDYNTFNLIDVLSQKTFLLPTLKELINLESCFKNEEDRDISYMSIIKKFSITHKNHSLLWKELFSTINISSNLRNLIKEHTDQILATAYSDYNEKSIEDYIDFFTSLKCSEKEYAKFFKYTAYSERCNLLESVTSLYTPTMKDVLNWTNIATRDSNFDFNTDQWLRMLPYLRKNQTLNSYCSLIDPIDDENLGDVITYVIEYKEELHSVPEFSTFE